MGPFHSIAAHNAIPTPFMKRTPFVCVQVSVHIYMAFSCNGRPSSTQAFQAPYTVSGPIGNSNYRAEYCMKSAPMADHVRTGTSSGNRRNNPHPTEEFMNWRIPGQRRGEKKRSAAAFNLTDEIMDRVCRGTLRSTYQADYLGAQQSEHCLRHTTSYNTHLI